MVRARSRALRWEEQKRLLPEEMRRAITTHVRMHDRWVARINARSDVSIDISRGLDAYAHRQADIYWSLAVSFVDLWSPELQENGIAVNWPLEVADYAATVKALPKRKSGRKKAKSADLSDSEGEDIVENIQLRGTSDTVDDEDLIDSDGGGVLHLAGYTDSEDSEEDAL